MSKAVPIKDIKNSHPNIYDSVVERCHNQYGHDFPIREENTIGHLFCWHRSEEGQDFWYKVNFGNFDVFYEKYPRKDKESEIDKIDEIFEEKVKLSRL